MSKLEVFIIESLKFKDEKKNRYEGQILCNILTLSKKRPLYYYIRTKRELKKLTCKFAQSKYRYLHISCHGSKKSMATTFDRLSFAELAEILSPVLNKKRLFLSACSMANPQLAMQIFKRCGCYSIMGPSRDTSFDRAAIFWASFYHLMLRDALKIMSKAEIIQKARSLSSLFDVSLLKYYSQGIKTSRRGVFKEKRLDE